MVFEQAPETVKKESMYGQIALCWYESRLSHLAKLFEINLVSDNTPADPFVYKSSPSQPLPIKSSATNLATSICALGLGWKTLLYASGTNHLNASPSPSSLTPSLAPDLSTNPFSGSNSQSGCSCSV